MKPSPTALVLGCGYVGLALARELTARGVTVTGTTRDESRFAEIEATGAIPRIADVDELESLREIAAEPFGMVFDLVRPQKYPDGGYSLSGTQHVVDVFGENAAALVYVSSTSVYGRRHGELTDEDTEVSPVSPVGMARVEAENIYLGAFRDRGVPARICRVPGIYGPGRTLRRRLESGAYRRLDDEEMWVSRIHVHDLVAGLIAAATVGRPGEVYLLCDDEPVTGNEYATLTATLLSIPIPPMVDRADIRRELGSDAYERRISSRRCSNRRMREDLGVELRYPTVREGVPAALAEEGLI